MHFSFLKNIFGDLRNLRMFFFGARFFTLSTRTYLTEYFQFFTYAFIFLGKKFVLLLYYYYLWNTIKTY